MACAAATAEAFGCGFRTTLRSGSVMHASKLPVRTWYKRMALMPQSKQPMSAHEMRRQLGMKRYEPMWEMMHKLREAMGQRDGRYTLQDMVEFDEAYMPMVTVQLIAPKRAPPMGFSPQTIGHYASRSQAHPDLRGGHALARPGRKRPQSRCNDQHEGEKHRAGRDGETGRGQQSCRNPCCWRQRWPPGPHRAD